ncbi:MAG TPA: hypothetical protein VMF32_10535 [Xanthobacteraceae bacterium]|nr:hypothetical protein [Xanthobacteraceae bacterium]
MTDAEKIAAYERIMGIIRDAVALERNCVRKHDSVDIIDFNRADAFKRIVETALGEDALSWPPRSRE